MKVILNKPALNIPRPVAHGFLLRFVSYAKVCVFTNLHLSGHGVDSGMMSWFVGTRTKAMVAHVGVFTNMKNQTFSWRHEKRRGVFTEIMIKNW